LLVPAPGDLEGTDKRSQKAYSPIPSFLPSFIERCDDDDDVVVVEDDVGDDDDGGGGNDRFAAVVIVIVVAVGGIKPDAFVSNSANRKMQQEIE